MSSTGFNTRLHEVLHADAPDDGVSVGVRGDYGRHHLMSQPPFVVCDVVHQVVGVDLVLVFDHFDGKQRPQRLKKVLGLIHCIIHWPTGKKIVCLFAKKSQQVKVKSQKRRAYLSGQCCDDARRLVSAFALDKSSFVEHGEVLVYKCRQARDPLGDLVLKDLHRFRFALAANFVTPYNIALLK